MDYIGATPQANPLLGLLAERLKQAQEFAAKPFGYSNPPAEMIMNLLGVPAVQQTAERLAYGEPLTTGRGMTTQIRPEAVEAVLTVAPVAGLLGKGTETAAMAAGRAGERYAEKVVPQIMERGGLPAQLLGDLAQGSRRQIFIGEKAKAWNKPAGELAKKLEEDGLSPKDIWQQTGTARGADGKWRQEISDAEALLTNKQKNLEGKLHETLQHPSLYENYPALQYYDAEIQSEIALPEHLKKALIGKGRGSFTEKDFVTDEPKITAQAFSNEDKGALLHEIQHAVQSREGFARGGSPEAEFLSRGNITGDVLSPEAQLIYENKGVSKDQAAMEAYRRLAGEAEARLASERASLTPEQRLQYFPFEERSFPNPYIEKTTDFNPYGLDVNPKDLIVRQGGLLGQSKAAESAAVLPGVSIQGGEKPLRSAVVLVGDKVFFGNTHADAIGQALKEGVIKKEAGKFIYPEGAEVDMDLFLTNEGQIIDRLQAYKMMDVGASESANQAGIMQQHAPSSMTVDEYMKQANAIRQKKEKQGLLD